MRFDIEQAQFKHSKKAGRARANDQRIGLDDLTHDPVQFNAMESADRSYLPILKLPAELPSAHLPKAQPPSK